jgi:hypothetical protein
MAVPKHTGKGSPQVERYIHRISGPLPDPIDLRIEVSPVPHADRGQLEIRVLAEFATQFGFRLPAITESSFCANLAQNTQFATWSQGIALFCVTISFVSGRGGVNGLHRNLHSNSLRSLGLPLPSRSEIALPAFDDPI